MSTDLRAYLVHITRTTSYRVMAANAGDAIDEYFEADIEPEEVDQTLLDVVAEPEDNNPTQGDGQR